MIGIVDIGGGNFRSVEKSILKLNSRCQRVNEACDLDGISKLIFPGVGSYDAGMRRLKLTGLLDPVKKYLKADRPFLGICLGMQLLSTTGSEGGITEGLGIVAAEVKRMSPANEEPLPHIGWNQVNHDGRMLFEGIPKDADFYFVHSFHMALKEPVLNYTVNYGGLHTSFVQKNNVVGVQFHPEKSQKFGLKFIENFINA